MEEPILTSSAIDNAAIEKANMPDNWKPYHYTKGDGVLIVKGCLTRPKKSGKNIGKPLYMTKDGSKTVTVTTDEVERHKALLMNQ